jgi:hypothetical protein
MKATNTIFGFFKRKGGSDGNKKSGFVKKSTIGLATLFLLSKVKFYVTRT